MKKAKSCGGLTLDLMTAVEDHLCSHDKTAFQRRELVKEVNRARTALRQMFGQQNKLLASLKKDAGRYRFLRSPESRNHKLHTVRAMDVNVVDWGHNLPGGKADSFWAQMDVSGAAMDREVDAAMRKGKRQHHSAL